MAHSPDPRTLLANERTFLSWLRTGISLMALGFVVAKFNLFVALHPRPQRHWINATNLGLFWVSAGLVVIVLGWLHYRTIRRQLYQDGPIPVSRLPASLAIVMAALGLALVAYLAGVD